MPIDPFSIGLSAVQTGMGLVQTIAGNSKLNALEKQRQAYKTPEEINKILQLAMSQVGGDTQTRDFQMGQLDRAFSASLGTAQRLGADANDISGLFAQKIDGIMKVAESSHASRTAAFGQLYNAYSLVADNDAAEQKSKQDILNDRIAAASGQVQAGYQNLGGGLNTALSTYMADKSSKLYPKSNTTTT